MATIEELTTNPAANAGRFIGKEEKHALAGRALAIQSVRDDGGHRYNGKPAPRWLVSVSDLATGELIALGMAKNDGRDATYPALAAVLADEGPEGLEPVVLYLADQPKGGNAFWSFRTATADEIAAAEAMREAAADDDEPDDDPAADDAEPEAAAPVLAAKGHRSRA